MTDMNRARRDIIIIMDHMKDLNSKHAKGLITDKEYKMNMKMVTFAIEMRLKDNK